MSLRLNKNPFDKDYQYEKQLESNGDISHEKNPCYKPNSRCNGEMSKVSIGIRKEKIVLMCAYHFWLDIKNNHKQKPSYKIDIQLDSKSKEFEFNKANHKEIIVKIDKWKKDIVPNYYYIYKWYKSSGWSKVFSSYFLERNNINNQIKKVIKGGK